MRPDATRRWYVRALDLDSTSLFLKLSIQNPDTPRASRVGARDEAAGRGGPGRVGRRRVCSHWTQPSLVLSWASKTTVLNNSSEARTREIVCKMLREQKVRLTSGLRTVYHRGEKRALFLAADQWATSVPTPIWLCKPFFPDMPCMKRGFTETKRRRSTSGHLGTKSASRPADKPLTNRLSTGHFVPAFGLHRISLVRASGETFRRCVHDALEGKTDACLLGGLICRRPVLTGLTSD